MKLMADLRLLFAASLFRVVGAGTVELESLMTKMEVDIINFARKVESLYVDRCTTSLENCAQLNYEDCRSQLPQPQCVVSNEIVLPDCTRNGVANCGAIYDYTVSTVTLSDTLPKDALGNPLSPQVIESVCYTRLLDKWFQDNFEKDASYWDSYGVESRQHFFGATDGTFRLYPGRSVETRWCGKFDPRKRPWYIAASSGPKNVVLILDTSGSMRGHWLALLKSAAKEVVKTLTIGDRIALVHFDSSASATHPHLETATSYNIASMQQRIDSLDADGGTNFYDAFSEAFDVLHSSITKEFHVGCNTAILFLTDGMHTFEERSESEVQELVARRLNATQGKTGHPVFLFTYSVSEEDEVHSFPKQLACQFPYTGVWSKINDDRFLVESLASYYRLFALGLGSDRNDDFSAWVEPYEYSTGGVLGTTISAPVYDRSVSPHLLIGVVGIDLPIASMDKALGVQAGSRASLDRVILASTAKCPALNLTLCEMESYRAKGDASEAISLVCYPEQCDESDFVEVEADKCEAASDYPKKLWDNVQFHGVSYEERSCCTKNLEESSFDRNVCSASTGDGEGAPFSSIVVFAIIGFILVLC